MAVLLLLQGKRWTTPLRATGIRRSKRSPPRSHSSRAANWPLTRAAPSSSTPYRHFTHSIPLRSRVRSFVRVHAFAFTPARGSMMIVFSKLVAMLILMLFTFWLLLPLSSPISHAFIAHTLRTRFSHRKMRFFLLSIFEHKIVFFARLTNLNFCGNFRFQLEIFESRKFICLNYFSKKYYPWLRNRVYKFVKDWRPNWKRRIAIFFLNKQLSKNISQYCAKKFQNDNFFQAVRLGSPMFGQ